MHLRRDVIHSFAFTFQSPSITQLKMNIISIITIFLSIFKFSSSSKILAIFPSGTKSHDLFTSRIAEELHSRGHNLTILTVYPELYPGMNTIYLKENQEFWLKFRKDMVAYRGKSSAWERLYHLSDYGYYMAKSTLINKQVQELMKSNQTFDLILLEEYFNEAFLGFAHIFKSPIVMIRIYISQATNPTKVGCYDSPSVVPSVHSKFTDEMSFWERVENTLISWFEMFVVSHIQIKQQEILYNEFFSDPKPSIKDLMKNISIVLQNTHPSTSYVQPKSPNLIEIGGLHISKERKPLPKEISEILDSEENGLIYFALGGNVDFSQFSEEKKSALLESLKRTNHTVFLKIKGVQMKRTGNILINDWFPQNDILAHPKTKVFITHGGIQSTYEAVYHAVPILGIPIYADQPHNVAFAVRKGMGILLDYEDITEKSVDHALTTILENSSFKEKAKAISKIHHDRQNTPLETAVYWIEYAIRRKGAAHLKITGIDMGFIQYHSLDVMALLMLGLTLFTFILYKVFIIICSSCFIRKNKIE
ncbi:UGT2A1.2 family protein [Megaselia abdita]